MRLRLAHTPMDTFTPAVWELLKRSHPKAGNGEDLNRRDAEEKAESAAGYSRAAATLSTSASLVIHDSYVCDVRLSSAVAVNRTICRQIAGC